MRKQVEDKMLTDLGMSKKEEPKKQSYFDRRPTRTFDRPFSNNANQNKPIASSTQTSATFVTGQTLRLLPYESFPAKSKQEFFADWVVRVGYTWQEVCAAAGTPQYEKLRDFFLKTKAEHYTK